MGFSLTGTHVIFFIASVIIASAVSGVIIAVITDVSNSLSERGERVQEQLDTEFKIINDPDNIPSSGNYYLFYLKNICGRELSTSNEISTGDQILTVVGPQAIEDKFSFTI
jgi:flagellar protein FlaG